MCLKALAKCGHLRIAVFVEHFPPRMGSDRRIYELMKPLAKKHEISFVCVPSFRELNGMIQPKNPNASTSVRDLFVHGGIIGHYVEIPSVLRMLWKKSIALAYVFSMMFLAFKTINALKKINPHVIMLNYPSVYTGLLGFLAAKSLRRSSVVDFNDLIAQYTLDLLNMRKSSILGKLIIRIQDLIVKSSDVVVAPTNYIKNYALKRGARSERVFVIPNGVDLQIFNKDVRSDFGTMLGLTKREVCLYFGRFDEWAGTNILREVGVVLEQKRPNIRLLLVGGGHKEAKFPGNTVLISEVPHDKVPEVISVADVVLVPFPESEVSHAASPLKLFEALAMGKPVVASRVSGIREVIEDGHDGLLVDPGKPEEWVDAVEAILDSRELQTKLSTNAQKCVQKYDWRVLALQLEDVLLKSTGVE